MQLQLPEGQQVYEYVAGDVGGGVLLPIRNSVNLRIHECNADNAGDGLIDQSQNDADGRDHK